MGQNLTRCSFKPTKIKHPPQEYGSFRAGADAQLATLTLGIVEDQSHIPGCGSKAQGSGWAFRCTEAAQRAATLVYLHGPAGGTRVLDYHATGDTECTGERLNRPDPAGDTIPAADFPPRQARGNRRRPYGLHESRKGSCQGRGVRFRCREDFQPPGPQSNPVKELLCKANLCEERIQGGAQAAWLLAGDEDDPGGAQFERLENEVA